MGKKHKHPEHENLERWLVSYADFITLLFATFVVLYALSQADLAKFKTASQSIKDAFNPAKSIMSNPGGLLKGNPKSSVLPSSGNSIMTKIIPKFPDNAQKQGTPTPNTLEATVKEINKQVAAQQKNLPPSQQSEKGVQIKVQDRGTVISFPSNVFFEPASAVLKPSSYPILDKIATHLKNGDPLIHVEGHTDNQPISTAIYPSNWELSSARASSVVRYLIQKQHIQPSRIAAMGYADTRPLVSNTTEANRQKNRRVDIVLLSQAASQTADAGPAQSNESVLPAPVISKEADPPPELHVEAAKSKPKTKVVIQEEVNPSSYSGNVSAKHERLPSVPAQQSYPTFIKPIDIRPIHPDILRDTTHSKDEASQ